MRQRIFTSLWRYTAEIIPVPNRKLPDMDILKQKTMFWPTDSDNNISELVNFLNDHKKFEISIPYL